MLPAGLIVTPGVKLQLRVPSNPTEYPFCTFHTARPRGSVDTPSW